MLNERIKFLRKYFKLTQEGFAARLGVKRGAIANYEVGRNDPADSVVSLICREFGVNETWLRTGSGEMLAPKASNALDALARERGLSRSSCIAIEKFLDLKPEIQEGIIDYFRAVVAAISDDDATATAAPAEPALDADALHAELDRQLDAEKEAEGKSEVS